MCVFFVACEMDQDSSGTDSNDEKNNGAYEEQRRLFEQISSADDFCEYVSSFYSSIASPPYLLDGDPYQCIAGEMSSLTVDDVMRRVNFWRGFYDIPPVVTPDAQSMRVAQACAMMMSMEGNLSHSPSTDWACYSDEGAAAAGISNLSIMWYGSPVNHIDNLVLDTGVPSLGHRRWNLYPPQTGAGYGYFESQGEWTGLCQVTFGGEAPDQARTSDEAVPFPPAGYFLPEYVSENGFEWSVSWQGADFTNAHFSMIDEGSGAAIELATPFGHRENGYGDNTAGWAPALLPSAGDSWTVDITQVSRGDENDKRVTYTVHFVSCSP